MFTIACFFCCRWKGENVATSEVADILTMVHCILEANVYGVKVEGNHSRHGVSSTEGMPA